MGLLIIWDQCETFEEKKEDELRDYQCIKTLSPLRYKIPRPVEV